MSKKDAGPEMVRDLWGDKKPLDPSFTPARELVPETLTNSQLKRFRREEKVPAYLEGDAHEILRYTREHFVGIYGKLGKSATQAFWFPHIGEVRGVQAAWEPWVANSNILLRRYDEQGWADETGWTILSGVARALHGRKLVPDYDKPNLSGEEPEEDDDHQIEGDL